MKHTIYLKVPSGHTTTTCSQSRSWRGIAQHITSMELEGMLEAYKAGAGKIAAPRGHSLTRAAFEQLCGYLKIPSGHLGVSA